MCLVRVVRAISTHMPGFKEDRAGGGGGGGGSAAATSAESGTDTAGAAAGSALPPVLILPPHSPPPPPPASPSEQAMPPLTMSGSTPAKKSSVELLVPAYVPFEARLDPDAPPDTLHGRLRIRLRRETTFKNVVIDCRGALTILPVKTAAWKPDSRIVYLSSVSLISVPTTLGAGTHEYPFAMPLSADMPCSLPDAGGMARVVYTLRARATKTKKGRLARIGGHILGTLGFSGALENERPVDLARSYPRESVEFQNVHEAEGQWKNKAMYSIALPHRAWAAGDTCMALVKLVPLQKDLIPRQLRITLREDVRIVTSGGPRTFTRHVSTTAVPVVFPKPRDVQETAVVEQEVELEMDENEPGPSTHRHSLQPVPRPLPNRITVDELELGDMDIHPAPEPEDEGPTVTASEPGPFSLAIPTKALPTYRNALITVRHHLDFLVQFGPPEPPDPPGGGVVATSETTISPTSTSTASAPQSTSTPATSPASSPAQPDLGTFRPSDQPASALSSKFHPETCRVSMGVRILSSHLLPTARAASLDNRTALFGPMPALMLMRERDNAVSESDSESDGAGDGNAGGGGGRRRRIRRERTTTGLPSYADHVADAIPQLVPLVEPSRLAMGLGGLRPGGHHSTFGTITGLSTIGGRSVAGLESSRSRMNSASVLALGAIAADLDVELDLDDEDLEVDAGSPRTPVIMLNGDSGAGRGHGHGLVSGRSSTESAMTRGTTRTARTAGTLESPGGAGGGASNSVMSDPQARRFFLMSRVPDYGAAVSVGGIAGIVPLSSTRQLPSYAEAIRPSPGASAAADGNRGERHPPVTQAMRLRAMEETRNTV